MRHHHHFNDFHGCDPTGAGHAPGSPRFDDRPPPWASWSEALFDWMGRPHGHPHGPDVRSFGGRGGRGFPPFGFGHGGFGGPGAGGPRGFGFPAGRKLSSSDLQLLLLALLGARPSHGYELIKALEERSHGFYVPSPGVIYPALTYLEETGEAVSEAQGTRKLYRLTDSGRARLESRGAEANAMLTQLEELGRNMDRVREAFSGGPEGDNFDSLRGAWPRSPEFLEAMGHLREVLGQVRGATRPQWVQIAGILNNAAAEIRNVLRGDTQGDKP